MARNFKGGVFSLMFPLEMKKWGLKVNKMRKLILNMQKIDLNCRKRFRRNKNFQEKKTIK
jgi:hypothetical protein